MKTKITISLLAVITIVGCQSTSSNANVAPSRNSSPTSSTSTSNTKIYPYKSAIIKYKQKDQVLIWDDWGLKTYESRYKDRDVIMINNGLEYRIKHNQKKITKMRNLVMDWLIVADIDLRPYYVSSEADDAMVKTGEHETVAGQNCNIWLNSIPSPSSRYCLYNDLILLKKETYDDRTRKWRVEKEAYMAKFNTAVDGKLFTNIPNYPTRNMSKYTTKEIHKLLREDPAEYKKSLRVAFELKTIGDRHRKKINLEKQQHKKMLELYLNRRIRNGIYYP